MVGSSQPSPPADGIRRLNARDARTTAAARLAAFEASLPSLLVHFSAKPAFGAARWRVQRQSHAGAARLKIRWIRRGSSASPPATLISTPAGCADESLEGGGAGGCVLGMVETSWWSFIIITPKSRPQILPLLLSVTLREHPRPSLQSKRSSPSGSSICVNPSESSGVWSSGSFSNTWESEPFSNILGGSRISTR